MKIAHLLKKENIIHLSSVDSKWALIELLVNKLIDSYEEENFSEALKKTLMDNVLERENKSSTSIGHGIAFPHGRIDGLNRPLIALAIVRNGVDFNESGNIPVKLVFLFLFPGDRHELGVKIQSVFARFLSADNHIEEMSNTTDPDTIYNMIEDANLEVETPITAQDLMKNVKIQFTENMLLHEATTAMKDYNTEVVAIVDDEDQLIGEVDCIHLFQIELPDYIKKLHSIPPIHDFNPFSQYFANNIILRLKDIMNKEVAVVSKDASLMEIIFLLAVKKHLVIHVCENGKLIGFIDRITVLDKVFNL